MAHDPESGPCGLTHRGKQQCHSITSSTRAYNEGGHAAKMRHLLQGKFDRLPTARHTFPEENPGEENE